MVTVTLKEGPSFNVDLDLVDSYGGDGYNYYVMLRNDNKTYSQFEITYASFINLVAEMEKKHNG